MAPLWEISAIGAPPSFCDMGNAIKTLIVQASGGGQRDDEECVLLSEEHSLVLTCCWVSLKVKNNSMLKGRLLMTLVNAVMFLFSSGNRNLFRFSGGKDAQCIQTKQLSSNKRGFMESITNIQEYSSQMSSLGKCLKG